MRIKELLLIFLFYCPLTLFSQQIYKGIVIDKHTKKPIEGVDMYLNRIHLLGKTGVDGKFSFKYEADSIRVSFFSPNYELVDVVLNKGYDSNIILPPLQMNLSEAIVVNRQKRIYELRRLKQVEGTSIYAGKKNEVVLVGEIVGNKANNVARQIYSQITGLNIYENSDGGLQLNIGGRGLDPNRTSNFNTRQNGYDISADVLGYPESYYTPLPDALSEIRIIRGAAALQYGTQFGGLIDFRINKPPIHKPFELVTKQSFSSYNIFNTFNSIGGTIGKLSYYSYFNYKKGDGYRYNSNFKSTHFYAFLGYEISDRTKLELEYTYMTYLAKQAGGLTDKMLYENPKQSNRNRNWFNVDWNLYSFKFKHKFSEMTKLSFNVFGLNASRKALGFRGIPELSGLNPITVDDEKNADGYIYNRDLLEGIFKNWGAEIRLLTEYDLLQHNSFFLIGAKYYKANNASRQGAGSKGADSDFMFYDDNYKDYPYISNFVYPNKNLALFSENVFNLTDKLSLTPGIRFEYIRTQSIGTYEHKIYNLAGGLIAQNKENEDRDLERHFLLLGLGISYKHNYEFEAYANLSQNYRSVTFSDIRTNNPTFIIDENITDEKGFSADVGIRGILGNYLSYDIGLYSILYDNRIGVSLIKDGPNKGDRLRGNIGKAIIGGFESFVDINILPLFSVDTKATKIKLFTNIAITKSEYLHSEQANVEGNQVEFIPFINFKSGIKYIYKDFSASLQYTYMSSQYTDATNAQIPYEGDERFGIIGEMPSYKIFDLSFTYLYRNWSIETGINNLLDKTYFTRRAEGYPGPGIIPADKRSLYVSLQFRW